MSESKLEQSSYVDIAFMLAWRAPESFKNGLVTPVWWSSRA